MNIVNDFIPCFIPFHVFNAISSLSSILLPNHILFSVTIFITNSLGMNN